MVTESPEGQLDEVAHCLGLQDGEQHPTRSDHPNSKMGSFTTSLNGKKKLVSLLDLCVSSLRRGHANLLCIVPILTDDPRKESKEAKCPG